MATSTYEIVVEGHLDTRWERWFDGMALTLGQDGTTSLVGPVVDQAALHAMISRIRDLGLILVRVSRQ